MLLRRVGEKDKHVLFPRPILVYRTICHFVDAMTRTAWIVETLLLRSNSRASMSRRLVSFPNHVYSRGAFSSNHFSRRRRYGTKHKANGHIINDKKCTIAKDRTTSLATIETIEGAKQVRVDKRQVLVQCRHVDQPNFPSRTHRKNRKLTSQKIFYASPSSLAICPNIQTRWPK
jgi:hypothetical protein